MIISNYLEKVNKHYKSGHATEHTYRGDFAELVNCLVANVHVTNEPSNVTDCGNPDYVITRNKIPIGFIEAKDLGKDLNGKQYKEQFGRYRKALDNLIITDYIWFQFFQNGDLVQEIRIAEIDGNNVKPLPETFSQFSNLLKDFCSFIAQTIKSPKTLAQMMASKARLLENILEKAITSDEENEENSSLKQQYETFKRILLHDLTPQAFSDIYAQTLAYGMFAARLHDKSLDTFSRQEAAELIPKSNPFLRKLFNHVAGVDIDERIITTVDNLADVFRATNVDALLKNFGKSTQTRDPIIHFYETFLAEYDPSLRKAKGVWYTPEPIVKFIVRGTDEILKAKFDLKDGLADTSKTTIKVKTDKPDRRTKSGLVEIEKEVHKVQVLDPATGTGTFLVEVVKHIYAKKFKAMQGAWSGYVEEHLIPRINGFELLMASYSMAHLKLDMLLTETGYTSNKNPRFNIFLTNSLEEHHPDTGTLFSSWLSTEANEANNIKRDTPVMVVLGNPPYSSSSSNKGKWILNLISSYKVGLKEKKLNLDDDYIKFIRYGEYLIEKNSEGVLAYISNNSFIDGLNHRQMRKELVSVFDEIYILNLHGNSKKKEVTPEGNPDNNVFDIMQGVSVNIFIKRNGSGFKDATVYYYDSYGERESKYDFLNNNSISSIDWIVLDVRHPNYFFIPFNYDSYEEYEKGFSVNDAFPENGSGLHSKRDGLVFLETSDEVKKLADTFLENNVEDIRKKYKLPKDGRDWTIQAAKKDLTLGYKPLVTQYRMFSNKVIPYTGRSKGILAYPRETITRHFLMDNYGLIFKRSGRVYGDSYDFVFITKNMISEGIFAIDPLGREYIAPLYLVSNKSSPSLLPEIKVNISQEIIEEFSKRLGMEFTPFSESGFNELDFLDYVYAILHSRKYRKMYEEYLKTDYPRVPYINDKNKFRELSQLGKELRLAHTFESDKLEDFIADYPVAGDNEITRKISSSDFEVYQTDRDRVRVWINENQYFESIPLNVWCFYIGGVQPAQKWLKDRFGKKLKFDDILHYQKIVVSLFETDRIMQRIEKLNVQ